MTMHNAPAPPTRKNPSNVGACQGWYPLSRDEDHELWFPIIGLPAVPEVSQKSGQIFSRADIIFTQDGFSSFLNHISSITILLRPVLWWSRSISPMALWLSPRYVPSISQSTFFSSCKRISTLRGSDIARVLPCGRGWCIMHSHQKQHINIGISTTLKTYNTDKQGILFLQFSLLRTLTFSALSRACSLTRIWRWDRGEWFRLCSGRRYRGTASGTWWSYWGLGWLLSRSWWWWSSSLGRSWSVRNIMYEFHMHSFLYCVPHPLSSPRAWFMQFS